MHLRQGLNGPPVKHKTAHATSIVGTLYPPNTAGPVPSRACQAMGHVHTYVGIPACRDVYVLRVPSDVPLMRSGFGVRSIGDITFGADYRNYNNLHQLLLVYILTADPARHPIQPHRRDVRYRPVISSSPHFGCLYI